MEDVSHIEVRGTTVVLTDVANQRVELDDVQIREVDLRSGTVRLISTRAASRLDLDPALSA